MIWTFIKTKRLKNISDSGNSFITCISGGNNAPYTYINSHLLSGSNPATRGKKHKARSTQGEKEEGGVERSGRSGLVHCFLACSSSSRHPSSLFKPEHRGCLAPGHSCQRLGTRGSADFPNHCLTVGRHSGKKIALLYSFNRGQAQFGPSH